MEASLDLVKKCRATAPWGHVEGRSSTVHLIECPRPTRSEREEARKGDKPSIDRMPAAPAQSQIERYFGDFLDT